MQLALDDYRIANSRDILTPALVVYPRFVDANIEATLRVMGGDPNRWRPHIKTAKMPWVIERLIARGVTHFKCATTRELLVACQSGAADVLIAYPVVGANARRVIEIAESFPNTRVSVLVENRAQSEAWRGHPVGIFIDVNPGMDRTGIGQTDLEPILALALGAGSQFRGIHYYDGHITAPDPTERERQAHAGYDRLMEVVDAIRQTGAPLHEVITSGTPAFPHAMTYPAFDGEAFFHRASPGTVVFNDMSSLVQMPEQYGYRPAALVVTTVVSHPTEHRITCNAGHKSVSADAGVPTCAVVGWPGLEPQKPSEEHLPLAVRSGPMPEIGELLYLLPRHVCPTVNNFDEALFVREGRVESVEPVAARGHEAALAYQDASSG
jgi:D-serine deaminase-like pyridoxal phosphate-dependent protein